MFEEFIKGAEKQTPLSPNEIKILSRLQLDPKKHSVCPPWVIEVIDMPHLSKAHKLGLIKEFNTRIKLERNIKNG